jgi:hypothetical protein
MSVDASRLVDKIATSLKELGCLTDSKKIIQTLDAIDPTHNLVSIDVCILKRKYPDVLFSIKGESRQHYFGLRSWLDDKGQIPDEYLGDFQFSFKKEKNGELKVKYLPMSCKEEDLLGPITFSKQTFNPNTPYDKKWITSNKIIFLLHHYLELSQDSLTELIIFNEPFLQKKVVRISKNVSICLKRLTLDQIVKKTSSGSYILSLY